MSPNTTPLRIAAIEPFYGGSHKAFLDGYRRYSSHQVDVLGLPARKWKWRMRGAALHFADVLRGRVRDYDVIFASDFLSLADLVGLLPGEMAAVAKIVYFHENQLTYPYRDESERDYQFAFTNITTCLAADRVLFNSAFHRESFLAALRPFLKKMPDFRPAGVVDAIAGKSCVLYYGMDLEGIRSAGPCERSAAPVVLWNHRWEYDKNPEDFFETMTGLADAGHDFRVAIVGEKYGVYPEVFDRGREALGERVVQFGYLESKEAYFRLLCSCDVAVSTAIHEFFGVSVLEAIAAGCFPLLPRRLTYPELLPEALHERHLYNTLPQLRRALAWAFAKIDEVREMDLRDVAERFSWERLVEQYDRTMSEVAAEAAARRTMMGYTGRREEDPSDPGE